MWERGDEWRNGKRLACHCACAGHHTHTHTPSHTSKGEGRRELNASGFKTVLSKRLMRRQRKEEQKRTHTTMNGDVRWCGGREGAGGRGGEGNGSVVEYVRKSKKKKTVRSGIAATTAPNTTTTTRCQCLRHLGADAIRPREGGREAYARRVGERHSLHPRGTQTHACPSDNDTAAHTKAHASFCAHQVQDERGRGRGTGNKLRRRRQVETRTTSARQREPNAVCRDGGRAGPHAYGSYRVVFFCGHHSMN